MPTDRGAADYFSSHRHAVLQDLSLEIVCSCSRSWSSIQTSVRWKVIERRRRGLIVIVKTLRVARVDRAVAFGRSSVVTNLHSHGRRPGGSSLRRIGERAVRRDGRLPRLNSALLLFVTMYSSTLLWTDIFVRRTRIEAVAHPATVCAPAGCVTV